MRFLSNINLIGEYFSKPDSLQVNFELSKFKVFEEIKIPLFLYLNK